MPVTRHRLYVYQAAHDHLIVNILPSKRNQYKAKCFAPLFYPAMLFTLDKKSEVNEKSVHLYQIIYFDNKSKYN